MEEGGRWVVYALILFIILGFFLRVYALGEQSLWIDESFSINAALEVLEKGIPMLDSGEWYARGILHTYLLSFSMLFGVTEFNARFVSVLFGTAMILIGYYLGKQYHSKTAGVIMSFLITFSYWQIAWSRQARMYMQFSMFFWLALLYFHKWTTDYKKTDLIVLFLATICALLSHTLGYSLFFVYGLYFCGLLLVDRKQCKILLSRIRRTRYAAGIAIVLGLVAAYKFISLASKHLLHENFNYFTVYSLFLRSEYFLFVLLSLAGIVFVIRKSKSLVLILFVFIPVYLTLSFLYDIVNLRYLFFLMPALLLLSSMYIAEISVTRAGLALACVLLILVVQFHGFVFFPQQHYRLEPDTPQPEFKRAYVWIENNIPDYKNKQYTVAQTAIHRFYLGKIPEYWVSFSFTGQKQPITWGSGKSEPYTNATIVSDTVPGTIGIYDAWSVSRRGFSASIENATQVGDVLIVDLT